MATPSESKLLHVAQQSPFKEIIHPWHEAPQPLLDNLDRLNQNPYLDTVILRGGNARRAINPPSPEILAAHQQAVENLSSIDPDYAETDWDLNFSVYFVTPEVFQAVCPTPGESVYVTNGCALTATPPDPQIQRQILETIASGWPDDYPDIRIKTSSATNRPYMVIGDNAAAIIPDEHQPVNKTEYPHLFELFAETIDLRHIPPTDTPAFSDQLQQRIEQYYSLIGPTYSFRPSSLAIHPINESFPPASPDHQILAILLDQLIYYPDFRLDLDQVRQAFSQIPPDTTIPPKVIRQFNKQYFTTPERTEKLYRDLNIYDLFSPYLLSLPPSTKHQ